MGRPPEGALRAHLQDGLKDILLTGVARTCHLGQVRCPREIGKSAGNFRPRGRKKKGAWETASLALELELSSEGPAQGAKTAGQGRRGGGGVDWNSLRTFLTGPNGEPYDSRDWTETRNGQKDLGDHEGRKELLVLTVTGRAKKFGISCLLSKDLT